MGEKYGDGLELGPSLHQSLLSSEYFRGCDTFVRQVR